MCDVGSFFGAPNSELAKMIRAIVEEEAKRLGMTIEIIETGDVSLAR